MLEVEEFIGVEKWYSEENFVINPETGYYCIKTKVKDSELHCLAGTKVSFFVKITKIYEKIKGRKKEELKQETIDKLLEYFKPFNDDLDELFPNFKHSWNQPF